MRLLENNKRNRSSESEVPLTQNVERPRRISEQQTIQHERSLPKQNRKISVESHDVNLSPHFSEFPGGDATKAAIDPRRISIGDSLSDSNYTKSFKSRRSSVFGHKDIIEKVAARAKELRDAAISCEERLVDEAVQHDRETDRYEGDGNKERRRTLSITQKNERTELGSPELSILKGVKPMQQQMKHHPRMRGRYRPALHPFISASPEERTRQPKAETMLSSETFEGIDYNDDEREIAVGALTNNLMKNVENNISLRKAFLSLGLMHLKGEGDDIKPDERLTMEDQVNIIAQTAMEGMPCSN